MGAGWETDDDGDAERARFDPNDIEKDESSEGDVYRHKSAFYKRKPSSPKQEPDKKEVPDEDQ